MAISLTVVAVLCLTALAAGWIDAVAIVGTSGAAVTYARKAPVNVVLAGLGIGFYDGLVGPGTGTFLVLALTAVLHLDLVTASATAKIVNCGSPHSRLRSTGGTPIAGALAMFAWQGAVLWQLAALMAVFNLAGGTLGSHPALKQGSGFVRVVGPA
ncbi:TSUP family transporter [Streptomyces sp. NPDC050548]|uniref:TSUP family transporter n=1 Tax=Streptomyces sp. NPDC050548 TaxID=3365629 RepID=UPI003787F559